MKINAITKNQTQFNGLWGNTKTNSYYDSIGSYYDVEKYYYPFANETQKEISKVVEANSIQYSTNANDLADAKKLVAEPMMNFEKTVVKVMEKLPFTASEYAKYQQNKLSEFKTNIIKNCIEFIKKA